VQGETRVGDDRRPGEQHHADREVQGPEQPAHQVVGPATQAGHVDRVAVHVGSVPDDAQGDLQLVQVRELVRGDQARADRAASRVHLGLGKVEGILSLDAAGRHVVAVHVAHDAAAPVRDDGQFRLGNVPLRIRADRHRLTRAARPARSGLDEQLRPFRGVDALVDVRGPGLERPRVETARVGHPGRPDLLPADRRHDWTTGGNGPGGGPGQGGGERVRVAEDGVDRHGGIEQLLGTPPGRTAGEPSLPARQHLPQRHPSS
jgi:hypothetical protein